MLGARHPEGVLPLHAGPSNEDVLNRIVEHVTHVEHTRHIGRRDDDCIGLAPVGLTREELVVKPVLIPFRFDLFGVVLTC